MFINNKVCNLLLESTCSLLIGDRGSGKSTLMAAANKTFQKEGFKVYCQYPYKGAFRIPLIEKKIGKTTKLILDKQWLYEANLKDSLVMIDEARTVWNSRAYSAWTESDEEFFNFIRKNNTYLILSTQRYDGVDLNIRYACDYTFFIQRIKFFKNLSSVDVSRSCQVKIADKQTQVVSRGYTKNAMKVNWDLAEMPISYCYFYRKPFYNDFDTLFTTDDKPEFPAESWDFILDVKNKSS